MKNRSSLEWKVYTGMSQRLEWIRRNQKWIMKNRNPAKTDDRTFDVYGVIKIGEVKADSWYWAKQAGEALANQVVPFKPIKSFVEER